MSARILWLVILIWAVLFIFLRETIKIGGNPMFNFMFMVVLFFVVMFFVRIGTVRLKLWWADFKRGLTWFLHRRK